MIPNANPFETLGQVRALVDAFERRTLPPAEWNHRAHLVIAIWYLCHHPEVEATERIITGIQRYTLAREIPATATNGYHETLTLFWISIARLFHDECNPEISLLHRVNDFLRAFGPRGDLHSEYYTPARLFSWRARQTWVEPDLQSLEPEHVRQSGGFVIT
jgi:hypothetical protein